MLLVCEFVIFKLLPSQCPRARRHPDSLFDEAVEKLSLIRLIYVICTNKAKSRRAEREAVAVKGRSWSHFALRSSHLPGIRPGYEVL